MNTQTETPFKRKARLGLAPLSCNKDNPTVLIQIESETVEVFTKKDGDTINFVSVTDLQTGETAQTFWVGGQVEHQLNKLMESGKRLRGVKLEINWKGKEEIDMMIDGRTQTTSVNQFDIFELE